jgi:uncharacterized protein YdaU (DUF1376 family)
MKAPAFQRMPWYPRDFACATRGWPLAARAIYRELLDAQWDAGGSNPGTLPADERVLRQVAGATPGEWRSAWPLVSPKFPLVDGGRRNERLEEHRQAAMAEFQKKSQAGKLGNQKRWGARPEIAKPSQSDRNANRNATFLRIATTTTSTTGEEAEAYEGGNATLSDSPAPAISSGTPTTDEAPASAPNSLPRAAGGTP